MTAPRFPRSPDVYRPPLEAGAHPFANEAPQQAGDRISTSTNDDQLPKARPEYVCTLPDRSKKVVILGLLAAGFAALSLLVVVLVLATSQWTDLFYSLPVSFFTLVFAVPAVSMGLADLRAIRAGAMESRGLRRTQFGWWLGTISLLIGLIPSLVGVAAVLVNSFA